MAATTSSGPAPLPALTLSQLTTWDTDHLDRAAAVWMSTSERWCDGYTAVNTGSDGKIITAFPTTKPI